MGAPVSTMIGSLPRTSSELTGRYSPGPAAARLGISQVSGATGTGSLAGIWELVITVSLLWTWWKPGTKAQTTEDLPECGRATATPLRSADEPAGGFR